MHLSSWNFIKTAQHTREKKIKLVSVLVVNGLSERVSVLLISNFEFEYKLSNAE